MTICTGKLMFAHMTIYMLTQLTFQNVNLSTKVALYIVNMKMFSQTTWIVQQLTTMVTWVQCNTHMFLLVFTQLLVVRETRMTSPAVEIMIRMTLLVVTQLPIVCETRMTAAACKYYRPYNNNNNNNNNNHPDNTDDNARWLNIRTFHSIHVHVWHVDAYLITF